MKALSREHHFLHGNAFFFHLKFSLQRLPLDSVSIQRRILVEVTIFL